MRRTSLHVRADEANLLPPKNGRMQRHRLIPCLVVLGEFAAVTSAVAAESTLAAGSTLQPGTYGQVNPGTKRVMNPGNQIVFVRGKNGRLSFSVNAIRALDLNQGYVAGTLPSNGPIVTWTQKEDGIDCKLTFMAAGTGLRVVQDYKFGDCGFGYGVLADGTYTRTAAEGELAPPPGP